MQHEFLTPGPEEIRTQIEEIMESYNHDWDILAELAQNSVDALRIAGGRRGHIRVSVNALEQTIEVSDNGIGFSASDLPRLLRPFGTNKRTNPNTVGKKGVGLKFVIFSSDYFELSSFDGEATSHIAIFHANSWLRSPNPEPIRLTVLDETAPNQGATIKIKISDENHPIFSYSFRQIAFILRTRTALGDTSSIWGNPINADFTLLHIDKSGDVLEEEFECNYMLPVEPISSHDVIDLAEYERWRIETDPSDAAKRNKLAGKIVTTSGDKYQAGRRIRYWGCLTPKRESWRRISSQAGILTDPNMDEDEYNDLDVRFRGEIQTATRGMPTGITLTPKALGSAGYLPNFFIILDDPGLSFDIGRKSIATRQQGHAS